MRCGSPRVPNRRSARTSREFDALMLRILTLNATGFGCTMSKNGNSTKSIPEWDSVLSAAAVHLGGVIFDRAAQDVGEQDLGR